MPHILDAAILQLNTEAVAPIQAVDMAGITIGEATVTPSRPQVRNRYFALQMKQRQVGVAASEQVAGTSRPLAIFNVRYNRVPKFGSWAPQTGNNQLAAVSLDI
ncbi:MAG: hypothetical protein HC880_04970 [Bacteroidia bacterium]|nr:hypothetical protein [Bacteroidia bacterium]